MLVPIILLCGFILLLAYYIFQLQQRYQYFIQRNIPTPPFQFFFGHMRVLWNAELFHRQLESWTKEYGKIYGIYEGTTPMFVVSDADFLQEVFVKQFSVFRQRKRTLLDGKLHDLFFNSGAKWRRQRHVVNPAFTAVKLKGMSPLIKGCVTDFMKKLSDHAENGNEFNIYSYYKRQTMDVICRCAFGIDTDLQNNSDNIYYKKCVEFLEGPFWGRQFLFKVAQIVPEFNLILGHLFLVHSKAQTFINTRILPRISSTLQLNEFPLMWLMNRARTIVEDRLQTPISRADLLQLMLQNTTNKPIDDTTNDNKANYRLTLDEVANNIVVFMTAGYETTSTALAYATYEIAKNPDILQKLQDEVDELPLCTDDDVDDEAKRYPDYNAIVQMPYMDLFISEVLRMYPIGPTVTQRCAIEDTVVQGIKIDKGSIVYADVYSLHYDRELWGPDDPYVFLPERHETKRHPMANFAFGAGPRQCIGMRFALIEMKILLTRLLREYTILPGEHLESKFILRDEAAIAPKEIWIKLVKRST